MNTPILLLIFNRPDTTARVFETIRRAKPKQLFIAADGPRDNNERDRILCAETKNIVKKVDWDCNVKTFFREKNLGCKHAVSSSITWFFENVEQGIILEDDCLPDSSFFAFCEVMLKKYRDNNDVGMISGDNFIREETLEKINPNKDEYYFVRPVYIWGWATWRRAWEKYDMKMSSWPGVKKQNRLQEIFGNKNISSYYSDSFDFGFSGRINTWDVQWFFSCLTNNMLCIIPPRNLVSNIGVEGTHSTAESPFNNMGTASFSVENLEHPMNVSPNTEIENILLKDIGINKFSYRVFLIRIFDIFKVKWLVRSIYRSFNLKF